ncbi:MAG: Stp1/IreP family PP2C-type Ser/Thr phosphatase [Anaerovoracaceae bacterium]
MKAVQIVAVTDIGRVREINEDYVFVCSLDEDGLALAILADGMGGHLAGEVASEEAVETIADTIISALAEEKEYPDLESLISYAVSDTNKRIYHRAMSNPDYKGMGTTIVLTLADKLKAIIGHIGDSRAYLFADNELVQLTSDHTLVNQLVISEKISSEEAEHHPQKNVLIRALGTDEEVEIELTTIDWKETDILLLCSDGLTNKLSIAELKEMISDQEMTLSEIAEAMVEAANHNGGEDNISLIILRNVTENLSELD